MAVLTTQQKNRLTRMSPAARAADLGDRLAYLNSDGTYSGTMSTTAAAFEVDIEDANATSVMDALTLNRSVTGVTAGGVGLGIGLTFEMEDDTGEEEKARLNVVQTDDGQATSDADFVFSQNVAGAMTETFRLDADAGAVIGSATGSSLTSLTIYPTTAGKGSLALAAADAGADYDTTITNAAMGQTTAITIPDPGGATANFLLSGSAQVVDADINASAAIARSKLAEDAAQPYTVGMIDMRTWDAVGTVLPAAAANDDMGLITGTFSTDGPTLQSEDWKTSSSASKYARFFFQLPAEYVDGEAISLRAQAGMVTTKSDGTATLDAEVYVDDADGAAGADICATVAQDMNTLATNEIDFTITPTGLVSGDMLDVRLTFGGADTATGTAVVSEIRKVQVLVDIKG